MNGVRSFEERYRSGYLFEMRLEDQDNSYDDRYVNHFYFKFSNVEASHDLACIRFSDDIGNTISFDGVSSISKIRNGLYSIECQVGLFNKKKWNIRVSSVQSYKH